MAHECPECGCMCYCNGDIDDCFLNLPRDQDRCRHYLEPECDGYDGDDDDFEYDPTDGEAPQDIKDESQANAQHTQTAIKTDGCA